MCECMFESSVLYFQLKQISMTSSASSVQSLCDQMLGEYNHSVLCYEQALQAQPGFEQALRRKHAVLCQQKLEQRLEAQHR